MSSTQSAPALSAERAPGTTVPNGAALAAFLAAGIGAFATGLIALLEAGGLLTVPVLYEPAGGVSGRTTLAVLIWLSAWVVLHTRWRHREIESQRIDALTLVLVALGVLLALPPMWALL